MTSRLEWRIFARVGDGAALVETALILSLLGPPLLLGTVEIGGALNASIEMTNAANAGAAFAAQYYIKNSSSALPTTAQVTTAVQNEAPELLNQLAPGTSLTVNVATGCGTGTGTAGNSVPSCSAGVQPFVQVTTQATLSPLIRFPGLTSLLTIKGGAIVNLVH
jgi:Flp pilus assembly protein TadG